MAKEGVIFFNMGGPSASEEIAVFLNNMFNDRHILTIKNNFLRKLIAKIIIKKAYPKTKSHYDAIGGFSPINQYTQMLVSKIAALDKTRIYSYAMNYTKPFAKEVLLEMKNSGVEKLVLFSMFPQKSISTTASSIESIMKAKNEIGYNVNIRIIENYYNNSLYIKSVSESIIKNSKYFNAEKYFLILSCHSLPQKYIDKGDTYKRECEESFSLVKRYIKDIPFKDVLIGYQSKSSSGKWLTPETEEIILSLKNDNIIIYPLTFTVDNSETLYELNIEYRNLVFRAKDDKSFIVCPCLNDDNNFIEFILSML